MNKAAFPFIAAALALVACNNSDKKADDYAEKAPVRVKIETAVAAPAAATRSFSGTVEESSSASISFATAGTIQQMNVTTGDIVAKGQLIATVDGASLRHAYDIAQATLNEARDAYDRMKKLHDAGSLPDMKWVEIENTLSQAVSAEAIARKALDDTRLTAPISGYVAEKYANSGQIAAPGVPIVKIVNVNPVKINISIPENEISSISEGSDAYISVSALGGETFSGKIVEKGVVASPVTRSYIVKIEVENPEKRLLPGMICDVLLDDNAVDADQPAPIVVPSAAVLLDASNQNFVWVAADGKADKRIVTTGALTNNGIIVTSGLVPGDSVIVAGQQKVSRGTPIVPIN